MKARPILFSGAMVRALLAGTKTQTRRAIKWPRGAASCVCHPPAWRCDNGWYCATCGGGIRLTARDVANTDCPYGVPGDLLWARESFQKLENASDHPSEPIHYMADGEPAAGYWTGGKPSIHMPRWASRLTLEITDVRVERLQDISEADAIAEGLTKVPASGLLPGVPDAGWAVPDFPEVNSLDPVTAYMQLWAQINGIASVHANPWVWCVAFKVHQQNVDALLSERVAA